MVPVIPLPYLSSTNEKCARACTRARALNRHSCRGARAARAGLAGGHARVRRRAHDQLGDGIVVALVTLDAPTDRIRRGHCGVLGRSGCPCLARARRVALVGIFAWKQVLARHHARIGVLVPMAVHHHAPAVVHWPKAHRDICARWDRVILPRVAVRRAWCETSARSERG